MPTDLREMKINGLLCLYDRILKELKSRRVMRSRNNPVADYTEYIVSRALGLKLCEQSKKGYDAVDDTGARYEIKGRRVPEGGKCPQLSALRDLDSRPFEHLVGVSYGDDFTVLRACVIPIDTVLTESRFSKHTNSHILHLRHTLWDLPGVRDITDELAGYQLGMNA